MEKTVDFVIPRSVPDAVLVSLELSRSKWLVTVIRPANHARMSRYWVAGGDLEDLLAKLSEFRMKASRELGHDVPVISIQEAGYEGFWLHRALEAAGVQSHIVDPASIAQPRRARNAKTDKIDGELLLRTLMAWLRGDPRVCSMVRPINPEDEDRRRLTRERRELISERVRLVNRMKGLLLSQGIRDYEPMRSNRRERLTELRTGDSRALGHNLKHQLERMLDRLELLLAQMKAIEESRLELAEECIAPADVEDTAASGVNAGSLLMKIRGIGPEFASVMVTEGLFRRYENRRQIASYAGLAPTPWRSGSINREQGISQAGNPRLRTAMIELAWLWLRHQPDSRLARWFHERTGPQGGRMKKIMIAALARKLLVALWKYVTQGVLPDGVAMKAA